MREKFKPLKNKIIELTTVDEFELYKTLFDNIKNLKKYSTKKLKPEKIKAMCRQTQKKLGKGTLLYEDLAPYLYFKTSLADKKDNAPGLYTSFTYII